MKVASQSTIASHQSFSPGRTGGKVKKAFSLKQPEEFVTAANILTKPKERRGLLDKSIEEKVMKAKQICQRIKSVQKNCKTSAKNGETAPSSLASFREEGKMLDNSEVLKRLKSQEPRTAAAPPKSLKEERMERTPTVRPISPVNKLTSLFATDDPQDLQKSREVNSFLVDEEQEVSIVEQHGAGILDWGLCTGKATEFRVIKFLDEGKYGKVYLAQSHKNNLIYSVKSIYRNGLNDSTMQQLIREVKIQSFLIHPHIVRLYNFFVDEESAYLVLQPCLGRNLYENLMEMGKVPERTVKEWVRQICTAVDFMHANDILHRDLKPQNILLHENTIKICDFGWAVHSPLLRNTQCGTPLYTPPEIVNRSPYDSKIDIWSIGILTYQLLYGTIPFQIRHNDDMFKIIEQDVYFSQETVVSQAAKDFMMLCLHKNPSERATIRQLVEHEFLNRVDRFRSTVI